MNTTRPRTLCRLKQSSAGLICWPGWARLSSRSAAASRCCTLRFTKSSRTFRSHGMIAGLISNGYYMTRERIEKLNAAGLEYLQISIDNITPDEVSQKSLKVLDRYLRYLSEYAEFHVSINSVIGGGIKNPEDALTVARRAVELGFGNSLGIIHDGTGQLKPLSGKEARIYEELKRFGKKSWTRLNRFQDDLAYGRPHDWRCRAGTPDICTFAKTD